MSQEPAFIDKIAGDYMADGKVVIETDLDSSGIKTGLSKLSGIAQSGIKGTLTAIASAGTALGRIGRCSYQNRGRL